MALTLLAANNAQTVLAAGISSSATSITVNTGTGSLFPAPVSGTSYFKLTLVDAATGSLTEIVHVTARTGDVMTIQRGQEGTIARAWSANDIAANMMTAGTLTYLLSNFQPLDETLSAIAALPTSANKLPYFSGGDIASLTDLTQVGRDIIGKNTVTDVLTYLGLGEGSLLPVGTPIPWPLAIPPTGFLKMNGATFDKIANPKLALAYPSGVLPDMRAQTIRGWDDGRGIDTGRALLSEQNDAIRNIVGSAANVYTGNPDLATGVISYSGTGITTWQSGSGLSISYRNLNFSAATQVPTATENRVKNVAYNYIVRAQ